jgi:hypothetical protein
VKDRARYTNVLSSCSVDLLNDQFIHYLETQMFYKSGEILRRNIFISIFV